MSFNFKPIFILALTLFLLNSLGLGVNSWAGTVTVDDIARELTCQCGCNMLVSACEGAMSCSSAAEIKNLISQKIEQGQSKEEIIRFFVAQYGEKVLAAPTKKGFNLTAWITPFLAITSGGVLIYFAIARWVSRGKTSREKEAKEFSEKIASEEYGNKLDKELKDFDF